MSMRSVKRLFDPVIWKLSHTKKLYVLEYFSYQLVIRSSRITPSNNQHGICWNTGLMYNSFTLSGKPPVITKFLADDLNQPGDVTSKSGFQLPCEASGTRPLHYKWRLNGANIKYGGVYRLLPSGTLVGQSLNQRNSGEYQCFVKNDYGMDFSRKLEVNVTGTKCSIIPDVLSACHSSGTSC